MLTSSSSSRTAASAKSSPRLIRPHGIVKLFLYEFLTINENLEFFADIFNVPRSIVPSRIEELLQLAQLMERRHDRVRTLSGGMQRRLNFIASLIHNPSILILDEPTNMMDDLTEENFKKRLQQIIVNKTVIVMIDNLSSEEVSEITERFKGQTGFDLEVKGQISLF